MSSNEKKGVTVKIDAEHHAEVRRYIEEHEMTMGDFVSMALQDELHPKLNIREDRNMGNMRTLAFQVPEELFQKIKNYLQRNNMSQKEFVIGLIETEIDRDLTQRATMNGASTVNPERAAEEHTERQETAAVSNCERISDEVGEETEEQESSDISDDFDDEGEDLDEDEDQDESENMGMAMGM